LHLSENYPLAIQRPEKVAVLPKIVKYFIYCSLIFILNECYDIFCTMAQMCYFDSNWYYGKTNVS